MIRASSASSSVGSDSATYTVLFWRVGTYTFAATPTDRYGAKGSSATVLVTVTDARAQRSWIPATDHRQPEIPPQACTSLYPTGVIDPRFA